MNSKLLFDLLERAGWTGAEAALGLVVVEVGQLPVAWAVPAALACSLLKGYAARYVGRKGTASTLPERKDPASALH